MNGTTLKLIAIVSMLIDHTGDLFFPQAFWMRVAGRIAMPVFAFCVSEGYCHTRDRRKYLRSLLLFGAISELPFDLAFSGRIDRDHQNIMFTFAFSVLALMVYDRVRGEKKGAGRTVLAVCCVLGFALAAVLLRLDYTLFAVIAVFLFTVLKDRANAVRQLGGVGFLALSRTMGMYAWTGISLLPLLFYDGKRGQGLKWLFYCFYPGHLLLLYLLRCLLS